MVEGVHMDYRDCFPRFPLPPGQPDELLSELHEAQNALAIVDRYFNLWSTYPSTKETPSSGHHSYVAHEALHEARNIIERVVEVLRIEVAGMPPNADQTTRDE
jgi:hypothetical protein